ncbi:MAG: NAD(P)-dependent oxidoreductase [Planctomycetota bacterium]
MTDAPPLVIQTEHLEEEAAQWLSERCRHVACSSDDPRFDELVESAEALVVRTYTRVDEGLLERAPRLRVVGRAGVGLDNIDVRACRSRGVEVVHTPDANGQAVTELVFAFLLDSHRPRIFLDKALERRAWSDLRTELRAQHQLADLTLGVVGVGRVGQRVCRIAGAFGMSVVCHDLLEVPDDRLSGATPVPLDDLLGGSDIVSVHVDGRPENRGLIGVRELALMQDDATLVNTSRGFVVDTDALASWLSVRPGARAMLDVHEPEPIAPGSPLLGLPNAHLSPHIGAATRAAQRNMSWVVRDVWAVLEGRPPTHPAPSTPFP